MEESTVNISEGLFSHGAAQLVPRHRDFRLGHKVLIAGSDMCIENTADMIIL